jgi:aquaporin Z
MPVGDTRKYLAEFFGTATLVLVGCGAVTIGGFGAGGAAGILAIALAFGLAVTAMAYAIGPVSGCHINPAVTIGAWAAGRFPSSLVPGYVVAQVAGAVVGALILMAILSGKGAGYSISTSGLGQNGWGAGYLGAYGLGAAFLTEVIATFLFVAVILGVTSERGGVPAVAGLVIGLTLFLLHLPFIQVTGLSVNPARSLGPALFAGGGAIAQVWLFIVAPLIGAFAAGWVFKTGLFGVEETTRPVAAGPDRV